MLGDILLLPVCGHLDHLVNYGEFPRVCISETPLTCDHALYPSCVHKLKLCEGERLYKCLHCTYRVDGPAYSFSQVEKYIYINLFLDLKKNVEGSGETLQQLRAFAALRGPGLSSQRSHGGSQPSEI